jgi:hypothetical protein
MCASPPPTNLSLDDLVPRKVENSQMIPESVGLPFIAWDVTGFATERSSE